MGNRLVRPQLPIMNLKLTIALCVVFLGVTQAYNCTYGLVAGKELYECNACKGPSLAIPTVETREEKSQLVALLLQIFLGGFAVGPFYYGLMGLGAGLICLSIVPCCFLCCAQVVLGVNARGAGSTDVVQEDEVGTTLDTLEGSGKGTGSGAGSGGNDGGGALGMCVACIGCLGCVASVVCNFVFIILIATGGCRPDEENYCLKKM